MFSSSPATRAAQEVFSQFGHCWAILLSSPLLHFVFPINNFALTTWRRSQLSPKKRAFSVFWVGNYASVQDFQLGGLPGAALTGQRHSWGDPRNPDIRRTKTGGGERQADRNTLCPFF